MIKLTEKLSIKADSNQYILGTPYDTVDKNDNPVTLMRDTTYYTTLAAALKAAMSKALKQGVEDNEITTLRQFMDEQQKLQLELAELLEPFEI